MKNVIEIQDAGYTCEVVRTVVGTTVEFDLNLSGYDSMKKESVQINQKYIGVVEFINAMRIYKFDSGIDYYLHLFAPKVIREIYRNKWILPSEVIK